MPAELLDGKTLSANILESLKPDVERLNPRLVVVQVGDRPDSTVYVRNKLVACEKIGIRNTLYKLDVSTSLETLLKSIEELNADEDTTGFIVQLPLPPHLMQFEREILNVIDPDKDVDGLTSRNMGETFYSQETEKFSPATPAGIVRLLDHYGVEYKGKVVAVVGQGIVVGKPLSTMLLNRGASTFNAHMLTPLKVRREFTRKYADILITAVGKPGLITGEDIKPGAVVVDAGIFKIPETNKVVGDIDFASAVEVASMITPVPGGVGPMTIAMLLENVVRAAKLQEKKRLALAAGRKT